MTRDKEIQFVVSLIRNPDGSFNVKMGLQTVGRIFVVPDDKPAFKSDEIHFGRWVWESDLPTGPADPGCSLDANESYEDRLVCVYSLLAAQARGACSLDGPPD